MRQYSHQPKMNIWGFHQTLKKTNYILMKRAWTKSTKGDVNSIASSIRTF